MNYLVRQLFSMIEAIFLDSVRKRLAEYKALGEKTMAQLDESDWSWQPNEASNSIALIVQHLHGNMLSRWTNFLIEDGEKEWRRRDAEFEAQVASSEEIRALWEAGWSVLFDALEALTPEDLTRTITIRKQPLNVVDAINRQLAHYSYHVGQIVSIGKWRRGNDWKTLSIPKGHSQQYNEQLKNTPS
jgi:hypothetical protein